MTNPLPPEVLATVERNRDGIWDLTILWPYWVRLPGWPGKCRERAATSLRRLDPARPGCRFSDGPRPRTGKGGLPLSAREHLKISCPLRERPLAICRTMSCWKEKRE